MKMTYSEALEMAIYAMNYSANCEDEDEAEKYTVCAEKLAALKEQLAKRHTSEKANDKRKAATVAARQELVAKVAPVLREVLTHTQLGLTAKEIFGEAQSRLPADFSVAKVQNVLLREMARNWRRLKPRVRLTSTV